MRLANTIVAPRRLGILLVAAYISACGGATQPEPDGAPSSRGRVEYDQASIHLLSRFAFGPTVADLSAIQRRGRERWFDEQLAARGAEAPAVAEAMALYPACGLDPLEQLRAFEPVRGSLALGIAPARGDDEKRRRRRARSRLLGELQMCAITRHALSRFQVREVMVDFWTNHFNVYARKGRNPWLMNDYVETAIRPNALGNFTELLLATAQHPAMLIYLDASRSVAPRANGRGLNENYAREVMELHTLGVHGGYEQRDVIEAARVLTGWTLDDPISGEWGFRFRGEHHDDGEKMVLGHAFPSGGGQAEGIEMLRMLAAHPSTAHNIAFKLVERFVADDPPEACVSRVAAAFSHSNGEIADTLRAVVACPEFSLEESRHNKMKSPLEFVVSAMRALDARPDGSHDLANLVAGLGQPLFLEPVPTGYPERAEDWLSGVAVLDRAAAAWQMVGQRSPGLLFDGHRFRVDDADLASRPQRYLLFGQGSEGSISAIRVTGAQARPRERCAVTLAIALSAPEFQRQ